MYPHSIWDQLDKLSSMLYYEHPELDYMPGSEDFVIISDGEPGMIQFTLPDGEVLKFQLHLA